MEVTPLDMSGVSRSKQDELQAWRQRQQKQFQLWLSESERLFTMQSQLCEKKRMLLQAQLEVDINKINKGTSKRNNQTSKGSKALSKHSGGTASIDIEWDLDEPGLRVDRLQQEFDNLNGEVEAQKKVVDDLLEQRRQAAMAESESRVTSK